MAQGDCKISETCNCSKLFKTSNSAQLSKAKNLHFARMQPCWQQSRCTAMSYRRQLFHGAGMALPTQPYKAQCRGGPVWSHPPLNAPVNPPPLGIIHFLFKASSFGPGLLGSIQGPRVNDVPTLPRTKSGINKFLIFFTTSPICTCQRLAASHHDLWKQVIPN